MAYYILHFLSLGFVLIPLFFQGSPGLPGLKGERGLPGNPVSAENTVTNVFALIFPWVVISLATLGCTNALQSWEGKGEGCRYYPSLNSRQRTLIFFG